MNRKQVGSSLRRGIAAGTLAGFFAGWLSFTAHSKQLDAVQTDAMQTVHEQEANLILPPVPGLPQLAPLPAPARYSISTGPDLSKLGGAANAAAPSTRAPAAQQPPAVVPAPAPTFAPLPTLPPAPRPVATTKPSGK